MVNDSYGYPFQAMQRRAAGNGCGELAGVWFAASATTPDGVRENEVATAMRLPEAVAPRERSPRPFLEPADFSPSAWRIEANQACAIMERVM